MLEIIKRQNIENPDFGELIQVKKDSFAGDKVQISYNSWGHLVVRIIQPNGDVLAVFDAATTREILNFAGVIGKK